jgi:uncharacterized protein involved in tolerance to divalent cations
VEKLEALEAAVRSLHPYEVPEFLILEANGGSLSYLKWIDDSVE